MITHKADEFTWRGKVGITEVSSLGRPWIGRLFADACDVGFHVKSTRTGAVRAFFLTRQVASEGDIIEWVFEDRQGDVQIRVIND